MPLAPALRRPDAGGQPLSAALPAAAGDAGITRRPPALLASVNRTAALAGALTVSLAAGILAAGPATGRALAGRPAVRIHVDRTGAVVAPASLRPGLVHVRNAGGQQIYLVRQVDPRWGVDTFVADYNAIIPSGMGRHFRILDTLSGHRDVFVRLTPGKYLLADGGPNTITAANVRTVAVAGSRWDASRPRYRSAPISGTGATLHLPASAPARSYLHLHNRTDYALSVVLFRVGSGTSERQLAGFIAHPTVRRLGRLDLRSSEEIWFASAHVSLYYRVPARAGRYLVVDYAYVDLARTPRFGPGQAAVIRVS